MHTTPTQTEEWDWVICRIFRSSDLHKLQVRYRDFPIQRRCGALRIINYISTIGNLASLNSWGVFTIFPTFEDISTSNCLLDDVKTTLSCNECTWIVSIEGWLVWRLNVLTSQCNESQEDSFRSPTNGLRIMYSIIINGLGLSHNQVLTCAQWMQTNH